MRWTVVTAAVAVALVVAGCSSSGQAAGGQPPIVAPAAACRGASEAPTSGQPFELVVIGKRDDSAAGSRYLTTFVDLNKSCVPGDSQESLSTSLAFAPNVTASRAGKIAKEFRSTGLFTRVTLMSVPPCALSGLAAGSCGPPSTT